MIRIKSVNNHRCYYSGWDLYFNGVKVHAGTFANLQALRQFWGKYMVLVCAGYVESFGNWSKAY